MQRFWKGLSIFGVAGIFYLGHGLHQYRLPGESIAEGQAARPAQMRDDFEAMRRAGSIDPAQFNADFRMQLGRAIGVRVAKRAPVSAPVGTYQLVWIPPPAGCAPDYGLRRINTSTGEVTFPVGENKDVSACDWMALEIKP